MLYEDALKQAMLAILDDRVASIANCIISLINEGYLPNKNKTTILDWSSILINVYENIDLFNSEQQANIDRIYNNVLKL